MLSWTRGRRAFCHKYSCTTEAALDSEAIRRNGPEQARQSDEVMDRMRCFSKGPSERNQKLRALPQALALHTGPAQGNTTCWPKLLDRSKVLSVVVATAFFPPAEAIQFRRVNQLNPTRRTKETFNFFQLSQLNWIHS